jgi:hypothetical protein
MPSRPNQATLWLTPDQVRAFLRTNGMSSSDKINQVLDGYDFSSKPLYFRTFEPREILFQFIRGSSLEAGGPRSGNWFCGAGATSDKLAIFGGGSGRRRYKFEVIQQFTALEGVARAQPRNWNWAGGGHGGGTQVFVPPNLVGHIAAHGPDE